MRVLAVAALCAMLAVCGCGKPASPGQNAVATNAAGPGSSVDDAVRTALQYDTIKAGRDAQDKARKAASAHNADLEEAGAGGK